MHTESKAFTMKRLYLFAIIVLALYTYAMHTAAQDIPTDDELRQRAVWLKEYETIRSDEARMDSLYNWSRILLQKVLSRLKKMKFLKNIRKSWLSSAQILQKNQKHQLLLKKQKPLQRLFLMPTSNR